MTIYKATTSLIILASLMTSCKSGVDSKFLESPDSSIISEEACVGLQGNGIRFPSHIGTYVSLMENNITPTVSLGGSSGSIVAGATMGLLMNSSLTGSQIFQGKSLSRTQQAAIVLAATSKIIDNFLFVPAINELKLGRLEVLPGIFKLATQLQLGRSLAASPNDRIVSIESVVAQSVLLTDFLQNQDFRQVFSKSTYVERRDYVFELWKNWANMVETDLSTLILAASGSQPQDLRLEDISDRFYRLFQQDLKQEFSQINVNRGKFLISGVKNFLDSDFGKRIIGADKVENLKNVKFFLPNPKIIWNAYRGFTKSGQFLTMPQGLIVHSTFRLSKIGLNQDGAVQYSEGVGLENLFQGYLAHDYSKASLFQELMMIRSSMVSNNLGFQPYFMDSSKSIEKLGYAFPFNKVLLFKNFSENRGEKLNTEKDDSQFDTIYREGRRGLAHAVAFSAGEPGPFRRFPVFTDETDVKLNQLQLRSGEISSLIPSISTPHQLAVSSVGLIAFGGWSENVPVSTLAMLPSCKKAKYYVTGSLDGDGNRFQSGALRAAIRGWKFLPSTIKEIGLALGVYNSKAEQLTQEQFAKINGNLEFSRVLASKRYTYNIEGSGSNTVGNWKESPESKTIFIPNNLNFDLPSQAAVDSQTLSTLNGKLANHRVSLMVASYQKMTENLSKMDSSNHRRIQSRINAFGKADANSQATDLGLSTNFIYRKTSVNEIEETLRPTFGD
jgi:hypothetical protein